MASLLSPEQRTLYVWTADIYQPCALVSTPSGGKQDGVDGTFDPTPVALAVPCYKEAKPNFDSSEVVGRSDLDNIFTIDVFHFPINWDSGEPALDVGSGYLIQFHATGHPEDGRFFLTQGDKKASSLMANKQAVYVRVTRKPDFLP